MTDTDGMNFIKPLSFSPIVNLDRTLQFKLERKRMSNTANELNKYIEINWPELKYAGPGVWVVGSTAYLINSGKEPTGDLDLICKDATMVDLVLHLLSPEEAMRVKTYMGGNRIYSKGRQVDVWALEGAQTIDDAINRFSATHPQARVAYEVATGKLTVYPNVSIS